MSMCSGLSPRARASTASLTTPSSIRTPDEFRHESSNVKSSSGALTPYAGVVGHPDATELVVRDCCHLTSASRSVLVVAVILGHRVVVVPVYVRAGQRILRKKVLRLTEVRVVVKMASE